MGLQLAVQVEHTLRGAGRTRGEGDRSIGVVCRGFRQWRVGSQRFDLDKGRAHAQHSARGVGEVAHADVLRGQTHRADSGQAFGDRDHVLRSGAAQRGAHAPQTEPCIDHYRDRSAPPDAVKRGRKVGPRWDEQRDPVASLDAECRKPGSHVLHTCVHLREGGHGRTVHCHFCDSRGLVAAASLKGAPERCASGGWVRGLFVPVEIFDPLRDVGCECRRILGNEVAGALVAVDVGVRHPVDQVAQVEVGEHRVPRAPQQQDWDVGQLVQAGGDLVQGRGAGVTGFQRDVLHELLDGRAPIRLVVGRVVPGADLARRQGPGEEQAAPDEVTGPLGHGVQHRGGPGGPDHRGRGGTFGLMHPGVRQDHTRQLVDVAFRPPQRDGPTPVVRHGDDRAGELQRLCQGVEIIDARCEPSHSAGPLREPHVEVVDGDHPPACWRCCDQSAPQVGPAGISVDAQQRAFSAAALA